MVAKTESGFEYPDDQEYAGMVFEEAGELTINLANVAEMKFEQLPKGTYSCVVSDAKFGMSKASGSPLLSLTFEINEGEYAGRKLFGNLSFSQKALPGTKANLIRISPELVDKPFQPKQLADSGYFNGKVVRAVVDMREYNGEMRSQIVGYKSASAGNGQLLS
jgi:hypothetical protein